MAPKRESARVVRLSILESYGVRWTLDAFARDVVQNFFDATPDFASVSIDVDRPRRVVEIKGPVEFDLDLLGYVGATTKNDGTTAGGFGEGFKICALVGTRDFGLTITAGSGPLELEVFFDRVSLGRELCYRVRERPGRRGSFARFEGCDDACLDAFDRAPGMFRHPKNPKLGEPVVEDASQGVAVLRSTFAKTGEIYYRRQLRGEMRFWGSKGEAPVTLAHDGPIDALEGDRDRRDLPELAVAKAIGEKLRPEDLFAVLLHLMPYWERGHDALRGFIDAAIDRKLTFSFPPPWVAHHYTGEEDGLTKFAERQGARIALAIFVEIGMRTARQSYGDLPTRAPTPLEQARLEVGAALYAELHGAPAKTTAYEVFDAENAAVAGQHLGDKVIVASKLLTRGLDDVAGTILHELAHEAGGEEKPSFLRRLTELLGAAIRSPDVVARARARYAEVTEPAPRPRGPRRDDGGPRAFQPEHARMDTGRFERGNPLWCTVVAPPAYPPLRKLARSLREAGKAAGVATLVIVETVTSDLGATRWLAPGLPTVYVGGVDVAPRGDERYGYRVRTYDEGGVVALVPGKETLARAFATSIRGEASLAARHALSVRGAVAVLERFGVDLRPAPSSEPPEDPAMPAVQEELRAYTGTRGIVMELEELWSAGLQLAGERLVRRATRRGDALAWPEIKGELDRAVGVARSLRAADQDFDDADAFDRGAMAAAQGAAVLGFVAPKEPASPERREARARKYYDHVRRATARVLEIPVALALKQAALKLSLEVAGLALQRKGRFDLDAFDLAFERAAAQARALDQEAEDEGRRYVDARSAQFKFKNVDAKTDEQRAREANAEAREAVRERNRARRTWRVKRAFDQALRDGCDLETAAARCFELARRLLPVEEQ